MKEEKKRKIGETEKFPPERPDMTEDSVPGINTPGIELPAFNPPVPNRAWTAMKKELEK